MCDNKSIRAARPSNMPCDKQAVYISPWAPGCPPVLLRIASAWRIPWPGAEMRRMNGVGDEASCDSKGFSRQAYPLQSGPEERLEDGQGPCPLRAGQASPVVVPDQSGARGGRRQLVAADPARPDVPRP